MKKAIGVLKTIILIIVVGIIAIVGYKFIYLKNSLFTKDKATFSNEVLEEKITEISELVTLDYYYTNAEKMDENYVKLFNKWNIPFTGKYMIVKYNGEIKYSVNMSNAKIEINENDVRVTIPHCIISSHELDEDSWEYMDQKSGLFNNLTPQDGDDLRKDAKGKMEQRANDLKLSEQADKNAVEQITKLINVIDQNLNVAVEFENQ